MPDLKISLTDESSVTASCTSRNGSLFFLLSSYFDEKGQSPLDFKTHLSNFLKYRENFLNACDLEGFSYEVDERLISIYNSMPNYNDEIIKENVSRNSIEQKLKKEKFKRTLTAFQRRNLEKLCHLKCAANFSVPGSGKTTEALAFYKFHRASDTSKLLVVGPPNCFLSWQKEIKKCLGKEHSFKQARGKLIDIKRAFSENSEFFITNFDSFYMHNKFDVICSFLKNNPDTTIIIDESHKMKGEIISELLMKIAPYSNCKMILTGTPMPQGEDDLVSQFNFLYPSQTMTEYEDYIEKFQPLYVRTTKEELGLIKPKIKQVLIKPKPAFEDFFQNYVREPYKHGMPLQEILQVESFKLAVMRLIAAMSNPYAYHEIFAHLDLDLASRIIEEGNGAKFDYLISRVKELVESKQKVLVWSNFTFHVNQIAIELDENNIDNVVLKGGIPSEKQDEESNYLYSDESDAEILTREKRITKFLDDPNCMVMVANPAAAAESMSLHEVCHHTIYLDRTFNAAQYLQSQDRIHRLIEKDKEKEKTIEILQLDTPGSIDFRVQKRLLEKISYMGEFLQDPSLENLASFKNPDEDVPKDLQTPDFLD